MTVGSLEVVQSEPPLLTRDDPAAVVWPADANRPTVIVKRLGEWSWCRIEGLGSFRFATRPRNRTLNCTAHPEAGQEERHLIDAYYRSVVPLALQGYGLEAMHGTALETPAGALVLAGSSHTGKSSLAYELASRGYRLLADDAVIIDVAGESGGSDAPVIRPIPFGLMLREQAAAHFGAAADGFATAAETSAPPAQELAAVVMLERVTDPATTPSGTVRLAAAEAFNKLLASAYSLSFSDKERKGAMVAAYLRLSRLVPVYLHSFRSGWEHLAGVADDIERLLVTALPAGAAQQERPRQG